MGRRDVAQVAVFLLVVIVIGVVVVRALTVPRHPADYAPTHPVPAPAQSGSGG